MERKAIDQPEAGSFDLPGLNQARRIMAGRVGGACWASSVSVSQKDILEEVYDSTNPLLLVYSSLFLVHYTKVFR